MLDPKVSSSLLRGPCEDRGDLGECSNDTDLFAGLRRGYVPGERLAGWAGGSFILQKVDGGRLERVASWLSGRGAGGGRFDGEIPSMVQHESDFEVGRRCP
jgi:hypothetical protein